MAVGALLLGVIQALSWSLTLFQIFTGTGKLVNDTVPDDVKDRVGEGGRIVSKRIDDAVKNVLPRLIELSEAINKAQEDLTERAGDTIDSVAPALQSVIDALRDTSERVEYFYNSVEDTVTGPDHTRCGA